jgi:hypothetical protein
MKKDYDFLPNFLTDFHDQKEFFKYLHERYGTKNPNDNFVANGDSINWATGCIYIIDWFLHFVAKFGYKLQKWRKKDVNFRNIFEEVQKATEDRDKKFMEYELKLREKNT